MTRTQVLIVEDEGVVALDLQSSLEGLGYEVPVVVPSGQEALEEAERTRPDLVLMDIRMPKMDGLEATRQIRLFNKDVIIIAQTAYALNSDRQMAIDSGCNDYISKPIDKDELQGLIRKYFIMT